MVNFDTDERKGDGNIGMFEGLGLITPAKQQFMPKKAIRKTR